MTTPYRPTDRFVIAPAGVEYLDARDAAPPPDECDCERDDDGMPMMCAACRAALAVDLDDDAA